MENMDREIHPLEPFLPKGAKLLLLGSFPPKRERWSMDFFYPNMQNDMWRILGIVFFGDRDYFLAEHKRTFCKERIQAFLSERGIAVGDTAKEVIRQKDNASDKFLEVVCPADIESILDCLDCCNAIVTTGQKATDTLLSVLNAEAPKVGGYSEFFYRDRVLRLYRMPSSSRAYPKPLDEKAAAYRAMFKELNML